MACPGSGKTGILVKRIENEISSTSSAVSGFVVLSFTNVGVDEIQKRLNADGFSINFPNCIDTIDGFCYRYVIAPYLYWITGCSDPVRILDEFPNGEPIYTKTSLCYKSGCVLKNLSVHILGQNSFQFDSSSKAFKTCNQSGTSLYCVKERKALFRKNIIAYNDFSAITLYLLRAFPTLQQILSKRFKSLFLDEAQDSSPGQMEIIKALLGKNTDTILLFGDYDQSIYEFRGANPAVFRSLEKEKTWTTLILDENYRCSQAICDAVYKFSHFCTPNKAKGLFASFPVKPIALEDTDFDKAQATFLALMEKYGIEKTKDRCCVLSRSETDIIYLSHIKSFEPYNSPFLNNITFSLASARAFYESGDAKESINEIEKVAPVFLNPEGDNLQTKKDYIMKNGFLGWKRLCINLVRATSELALPLNEWKEKTINCIKTIDNSLNLSQIQVKRHMNGIQRLNQKTLASFLHTSTLDPNVLYSTIHGVKGESFDAVLIFMKKTSGTLSYSCLCKNGYQNENVRIGYVGMTRARKLLVIASESKIPDRTKFSSWNIVSPENVVGLFRE